MGGASRERLDTTESVEYSESDAMSASGAAGGRKQGVKAAGRARGASTSTLYVVYSAALAACVAALWYVRPEGGYEQFTTVPADAAERAARRSPTDIALGAGGAWDYVLGDYTGGYLAGYAFVDKMAFINGLVLGRAAAALPHTVASQLRNYLGGSVFYYSIGFVWMFVQQRLLRDRFFPNGVGIPTWEDMRAQMYVAQKAMFGFALAPTIAEWVIERGWTHVYEDMSGPGALHYVVTTAVYLLFIECGIYWIHRWLHEFPTLYRLLHATHHKYNKENSLSPFASLAFDPWDGVAQASPYTLGLFLIPVHFWTHVLMLAFTAIWATNIHDTIIGNTEPVMGAGYHTIHHTDYVHNYGQFFTFMDRLHGTLASPSGDLAPPSMKRRVKRLAGAQD